MPFPKPTAMGRLPVIAVIGAAVATAMNTTPTSPTELALSRWTCGAADPCGDSPVMPLLIASSSVWRAPTLSLGDARHNRHVVR